MIYGSFVDMKKIAEEAGCDVEAAFKVSALLLESLHKTLLLNGLTGSLLEATSHIGTEAAYHLGGIYTAIGDGDTGGAVSETLLRLGMSDVWEPFHKKMDEWEQTLTEKQKTLIKNGREKD